MSGKFLAVVCAAVLLCGVCPAAQDASGGAASSPAFWAEMIGKVVVVTEPAGGRSVLVVPDSGLPVRIADAGAEWERREGMWVEIEGTIAWREGAAWGEVWEFSIEDHPPRAGHALETEGVLSPAGSGGGPLLLTRTGNVRLAGSHRLLHSAGPDGLLVEVKGELIPDGESFALQVTWMEID